MKFRQLMISIASVIGVMCLFAFGAAAQEENYTLSPTGSSSGSLSETNTIDWWQITTPSDGALTVTTTSAEGLDIDLYLCAPDKETVLAGYDVSTGTVERTHHYSLGGGTYWIKAYRWSGAGTYTISSQYTANTYENDTEDNGEAAAALTLAANGGDNGHLGYYYNGPIDVTDWWKVNVPLDGALRVTTASDTTLDIDLYLVDVDRETTIAGYDISTGSLEGTHHNNLEPGTYYIKAYRWSGYGGYSITSEFTPTSHDNDPEDNDTFETAVALDVNGSDTGHLGHHSIAKTDVIDFWSVTIPADGSILVETVSDSTLDIDLYFLDEDGTTQIAGYDISTGIVERTHLDAIGPGTYYIKVYRWSGYGGYTIESTFSRTLLADDGGPNDTIAAASPVSTQTVHTGHLGHYRDSSTDTSDYFLVTVPAGWDTLYVRSLSDSTLDIDISVYRVSDESNVAGGSRSGIDEWSSLVDPGTATYAVRMYRYYGWGAYSFIVTNSTAARLDDTWTVVADDTGAPEPFALLAPYPNPFNPSTTVSFNIPERCPVRLTVYDILGREVAVLADGYLEPGIHSAVWQARDRYGDSVGAGVYFVRLTAGTHAVTRKVMLVK